MGLPTAEAVVTRKVFGWNAEKPKVPTYESDSGVSPNRRISPLHIVVV